LKIKEEKENLLEYLDELKSNYDQMSGENEQTK